jgi:hypothetical protein
MSSRQQVKIGKLFGGAFYDLTRMFLVGTSITNYENKINFASFVAVNNFETNNYIQHKVGATVDGTHLDVGDIIQVYRASDNLLVYEGQINELKSVVNEKGICLNIQTYAYPAIGLNRTRVNNTYGTWNNPLTVRQILVSGKEIGGTVFPYYPYEHYTEDCTTNPTPGFSGASSYDWRYAIYPSGTDNTFCTVVTSDGSYTPKTGTHFIKMGNTDGYSFNARFGKYAAFSGTSYGFPLMIDDLSRPTYDATTGKWTNIPYLDFYIYRYHTANTFNIELQMRVGESDYIRFQLTDQDHNGAYDHWDKLWGIFYSTENQNLDLIPSGGAWVHLRIPCGTKWGEDAFYAWRSGDPDADWAQNAYSSAIAVSHSKVKSWMCAGGVTDIIGHYLSEFLGWDSQHQTDATGTTELQGNGSSAWNGVNDVTFYITQGTPKPTSITVGLDGFLIGNLNAGYTTIYDYVANSGPNPYAINFDYVGDIIDTSAVSYTLPYINCIWEQATKTLMDISNLLGGIAYRDSHNPGIHWTVTPDGYLVVAPLGNHNINGKDGSKRPELKWPTYSKYTLSHPLVLPAQIVQASFTKKEYDANFVIANAVFQDPPLNEWCNYPWTKYTTSHDYYTTTDGTNTVGVFIPDPTASDAIQVCGDAVVGPNSISIPKVSGGIGITDILYFKVNDLVDLNLITDAKLSFWIKTEKLQTVETRIYTDLYDVPTSVPPTVFSGGYSLADQGLGNYFWTEANILEKTQYPTDWLHAELQNRSRGWVKIELPLGASVWRITNHATWSKPILMVLFRIVGGSADGFFFLDGLNINGVHLRAAYSPAAMAAMGGRKEALINELIYSGSKLQSGAYDQLDNLLIQECRKSTTTPTVGPVKVPLDFSLMPGQMYYISSPPFGSTPKQFRALWVQHEIVEQLQTTLYLTDDVTNSYARDPSDSQSNLIRAVNPDYQNRSFARLAVVGVPSKCNISKIIDIDAI